MTNSRFASTILSIVAIGGMVVAPTAAFAFDHDKDKHHGNDNRDRDRGRKDDHRKDDKHWNDHRNNGKSPKDRGLHDNRNQWWKDDHRRNDDHWREEQRRRDDQRRREEAWRRSHDVRYRNNDNDYLRRESEHRQNTKNEWRNIALVGGGVALLGLLKHDNTLTFAGTAGALYSLYPHEQDRKSQSKIDRLRASYFSRPYFERDGRRYDRVVVNRGGQRYYQFRRH